MRRYEITIDDPNTKKTLLNFGCSSQNPQGPEIQFNIQLYQSGATVNDTITMFNIQPFYFNENQNLYGKHITLSAGFDLTPLTKKIGYSGIYGQIIDGYITNAITEWKGRDTQLALIVNPYFPGKAGPSLMSVKIGDLLLPKIAQAVTGLTGNAGLLELGNIPKTLTSKENYQHIVSSAAGLDNMLQATHGITLAKKDVGFTLFDPSSLMTATSQKTVYLKEGDFICQPSLMPGTTAEVAITLMMRSDIKLYDYVVIPQDIYIGMSALDVVADANGLNDMFKGKTVFSMFSGTYRVNSIWQLGDVKSPDAMAWATTLQGTKV